MKNSKFIILSFLFFLAGAQKAIAQLSPSAEISIITCQQGDDLYNVFGHTAIRIYDPEYKINEIYNYGIFEFKPGFGIKFLRGKLLYKLGKQSFNGFIDAYTREKRSVLQQKLNISLEEKINIYRALKENYKPENREYLYDFFFDNCTTRVRDLLEKHISGLQLPKDFEDITHRHLLDKSTFAMPWTDFGMDLIIGARTDKKTSQAEQLFLPFNLYALLNATTKNGQALVEDSLILLDYDKEIVRRSKKPFITPTLVFGIFLLLEIFFYWQKKKGKVFSVIKYIDTLWFSLLGIGGLVILFMWFGTDHTVTKINFNLLWMSPLFFFSKLRKNKFGMIILLVSLLLALLCNLGLQEMHIASILIIVTTILKLSSNYIYTSR